METNKPSRRFFLKSLTASLVGIRAGMLIERYLRESNSVTGEQSHAISGQPVISVRPPKSVYHPAVKNSHTMPFDWIGCYPRAGLPRNDGQSDDTWDSPSNQKRLVSYLNRRREILSSDSVILKTNSTTEAEWQKMLGTVDTMDDKLAQANTIFHWIRANISYDNEKGARSGIDDLEWFKAPQDTLASRKGVCIDQALLAMESLRLVGFSEKDISVQSMLVYNLDGTPRMDKNGSQEAHAVLGLNIDGKKYVMDLTDRVGLWHEAKYYWPGGITGGEIMKPYMATNFKGTTYYQKNFVGPRALSTEENQALVAPYSADDKQRYESIPGLPPLQSYEIKKDEVDLSTLRKSPSPVIMTSPTSGCVGKGCGF